MSILDSHRTSEARKTVHENVDETKTLKSILSNDNNSALFATYLNTADAKTGQDVATRLKNGALEEADLEALSEHRGEFVKRMDAIGDVKEYVNENTLNSYLAHSPELQKVVNLAGPGGTMKALNHHLELMAMTDPDKFNEIKGKVDKLHEYRTGLYKDIEDQLIDKSQKYKLNPESVSNILMSNKSPEEKKKAIKQSLQQSLHWTKRIFGNKGRINELLAEEGNLKKGIDVYNQIAAEVGSALNTSVRSNELVRQTFSEILIGDKPQTIEKGMGFKTAREELSTSKTIEQEWETYCTENDITEKTSKADYDAKLKEFKDKQTEKAKEKKKQGGWLAILFSLFDDKIKTFNPTNKKKK